MFDADPRFYLTSSVIHVVRGY